MAGRQAGSGEREDGALSGGFDASTARQIGSAAGYLSPGIGIVYDGAPSRQKALEQALREAARITICGVAPRSLVIALQNLAEEISCGDGLPAWDEVRYVTPAESQIFANHGVAQLGPVVQRWQSALIGISNCANRLRHGSGTALETRFEILGAAEMYLGVVLIVDVRGSNRRRAWISAGPDQALESLALLVVDDSHEIFDRLARAVEQMAATAAPILIRQLVCEVLPETAGDEPSQPRPAVTGLRPFGATPTDPPSCLPVAITALRSGAATGGIVLLKKRNQLTDTDDFGKLSLLSSRLLESDLAAALNVPLAAHREPDQSLDEMWKGSHQPPPLRVPHDAFVRAAQREIFATCGLDIAADRFLYQGWQTLPREDSPLQLLFVVFVVVLLRGANGGDELTHAEVWNTESLERVSESQLYAGTYANRLNRFLTKREEWLRKQVFSTAIDPLSRT